MPNNFTEFSEIIKITPEEAAWIKTFLTSKWESLEGAALDTWCEERGISDRDALSYWPNFKWALQDSDTRLWLFCEEGFTEEHLIGFVQAYLDKFHPNQTISITGACTCSKPVAGEFGGWWMVIGAKELCGGDTWEDARIATEKLATEDPQGILLAACKTVLKGLEDMTTEQFRSGEDKPLRDQLMQAIAKGDTDMILCPSCQMLKGREETCPYCHCPGETERIRRLDEQKPKRRRKADGSRHNSSGNTQRI